MKEKRKNLCLKATLIGLFAVAIMFGFTTGSVLAQDDKANYEEYKKKEAEKNLPPHKRPPPHDPTGGAKHANLAQSATNPIAPMIQFQVQDVLNWENHNSSGASNALVIQPVIPVPLPWTKVPMLITRTTLPYVWTQDLGDPIGHAEGFGDLTLLGLFTPKIKTKGIQLGLGYTVSVPTAGDNEFTGSGKWEAGPSFLYINMKIPHLQWGLFAFQEWSFAGDNDREDVSKLSLQPFITYHLSKGWYVASPDSPQVYNFKNSKWTWALGGQLGKVTKIGKQPVKLFAEVLYNPEDNAGPTPEWTAKFNITFLFPE